MAYHISVPSADYDKAADYKCVATYTINEEEVVKESAAIHIYIRGMTTPLLADTVKEITVTGESQVFVCKYKGDSDITSIAWTVNDSPAVNEWAVTAVGSYDNGEWESTLTKTNLVYTDGGTVKCAPVFGSSVAGYAPESATNFIVREVVDLAATVFNGDDPYTISCEYKGTDDPNSLEWTVDDQVTAATTPGSFGNSLRTSTLEISGRAATDAPKDVVCKWVFTSPADANYQTTQTVNYLALTKEPDATTYGTGETVSLTCEIGVGTTGNKPTDVKWFKGWTDDSNTALADSADYTIVTDADVAGSLFKTILEIKATTVAHAGSYRCKLDELHATSNLIVRLITMTPSSATSTTVYANAGISVSCTIKSSDESAAATPAWTDPNSGAINTGTGGSNPEHTLDLPLSSSDGLYTCTVNFAEGNNPTASVALKFRPITMTTAADLYAVPAATGATATIACQVASDAELNDLVFRLDNQDVAATRTTHDGSVTTLELDVPITDYATQNDQVYRCQKSATEYSDHDTTLKLMTMTTELAAVTRGMSGDTADISCVASWNGEGANKPVITWTKDVSAATEVATAEDVSTTGVKSTITVTIAADTDGSTYTCTATYSGLTGTTLTSASLIAMSTVTAVNVDSLASTSATVGCTVSGIITALTDIKWYDSNDGELNDGASFTLDDGTLNGSNEQTTTLTVTDGVTEDTTYKCEIGGTKYSASINVYTVAATSVDSLASTSATVGCTVTGITTALAGIKWYDTSGSTELTAGASYALDDGSLGDDIQTPTLTVKEGVDADTTYKCEIHGTKYDASIHVYTVTAVNVDSLATTSATVGCTVTGITTALSGIKWYDSTGNTDLTGDGDHTLADGSLDGEFQTTTLTVTNGVTADTTYKCEIHGTKYDASINVYTVTMEHPSKITSVIDTIIICKVQDASQTVPITWYDNSDNPITGDNTNYITNGGSKTGSLQSATLTIKPAMLDTLPKDVELTYKCETKSGYSPLFKSETKFTIVTFDTELDRNSLGLSLGAVALFVLGICTVLMIIIGYKIRGTQSLIDTVYTNTTIPLSEITRVESKDQDEDLV